ncbi:MAG: M36 family metallopeptidase [Acidobacteriota bacterium]|nr:M36 family metallopeptidase [Acidobacteriota bacterium]
MKGRTVNGKTTEKAGFKILTVLLFWSLVLTALYVPSLTTEASSSSQSPTSVGNLYYRPAKNFDLNLTSAVAGLRAATGEQLEALNALKTSTNASNMTVRWNAFGGSPDVVYDFASQPFSGTPEEAGRAFIQQNAAAFGVANVSDLKLFSQREALGGYLVRFSQTFNGIDVKDGGIGIVMNANKQVIMASGPYFRDVNVNTTPSISAEQARSKVDADLAQYSNNIVNSASNLFQPALNVVSQQTQVVNNLQPKLGIYPTADGYKLVWKVAKMSTNPFGLYAYSIDAHTGEIVARKDFVNFQQNPVHPFTGDIYPKYPDITPELKDQSIIKDCVNEQGITAPCGQVRVKLRSFDQSNVVTGLNGTLTGTHALVNNVLPTKQPFAQAALGTWHFRKDDPTAFEARTNEQDQFAEPAEHQDEINAFFFVTYLLEYVDYLHIAGDNRNGLPGQFPDEYPNKTIPLPATVHFPNIYAVLPLLGCPSNCPVPSPTDPDLSKKLLGLDNAIAVNVTSLIEEITAEKSPVVVNPTFYGHGYLLNDLALEGTVPYHEGMHAITSPIAGLEGIEGSALNEGQADMWAFTITDNPSLGDYVVNAKGYRQRFRDRGRDPDSVAYIRSARSTLKYSDIATYNNAGTYEFEEHRDGEIYMSTMWDIREMMNRVYPQASYKRPRPSDGQALKVVTKGTEIFERDFLGSMYILGTTSPDTLVKAKDAMIVADQMLYSSDPTDPDAPGKHRAMIEQIFAAKELGVNALEVTGGKATISTQVTPFVGNQQAPNAPTNVQVVPASPNSLKVYWEPVQGAVSYQVLKRRIGFENRREPNGKREFADGDASTTGFRHVAFVNGNQPSFEDKGAIYEVFAPVGLSNLFDHEYVVRAIGVNSTGQLGFSNLSGSTRALYQQQDLTAQIDSAISNITFSNGVMAFDNKLTNARGALSTDKTIYGPISFQVTNISNPTVRVKNADQGGNTFIYNQTLPLGATSNAKRLEFEDPAAQLFTFDAKISGGAFGGSTVGTGSQGGDGTSDPPAPVVYSLYNETRTGALAAGEPTATGGTSATWGNPMFKGITWDDVEITTKNDALFLEALLTSPTAVDLDFELRTVSGQVLTRSAGATATEFVSSAVQPNTKYILRVLGFANGPANFNIATTQLLPNGSPNENGGTRTGSTSSTATSGGAAGSLGVTRLVRFTVNPALKSVTFRILQ